MTLSGAINAFRHTTKNLSWKPTGRLQQTLAGRMERSGITLHSGKISAVKLCPEVAGGGRNFDFGSYLIPASIDFVQESPLCTTLAKSGYSVRTVEHLLSALEAMGVDNCRIQIRNLDSDGHHVEVPILDGSAREWVEAIQEVGLEVALDRSGNSCIKLAPYLEEPVYVQRKDSFIAAFPSSDVRITYGIDFPQAKAIGCQWFSSTSFDDSFYEQHISCSRNFCIYEEVERMRNVGLIKGGSTDNAIVCSATEGWLNPLRFHDEPCRHKVLDLIGDLSLFARSGSQGLPVAHMVCFKGGHSLHAELLRGLLGAVEADESLSRISAANAFLSPPTFPERTDHTPRASSIIQTLGVRL